MLTVITTTRLRRGVEDEWDAAIGERFRSAHGRKGWVSGQLLYPEDASDVRVIVGTWESRADWEAWHDDPAFLQQREKLETLASEPSQVVWYSVVADARQDDARSG
jgi:heme-degrading monooxygenase HmoA